MIQLRDILETDIERIATLCNEPLMNEMILTIPYPYTVSDAAYFYHEVVLKQSDAKNARYFAICLEHSPELIGTITLHFSPIKPFMAMVGYWLGKEYRGHGYMTEALRQVIEIGFHEYRLKRIYATHKPENKDSGNVMLRAGMLYEGTLKSYLLHNGVCYDSPHYAIINPNI